jgi:hypothetical protein
MQIKTISAISISDFWAGIRLHEAALRQGDLDGACGPYSIMMALILSEVLSLKQAKNLWNGSVDGRTTFSKFVKKLDALVTKGTTDDDLKSLFLAIQRVVGTPKIKKLGMSILVSAIDQSVLKGLALLSAVQHHIDTYDRPVILMLDWSSSEAHWVVAVGYQVRIKEGKQELANILTLDPGAPTGKISAWNGVLGQGGLKTRKLRYTTDDGLPTICSASQGFGFKTTKPKSVR